LCVDLYNAGYRKQSEWISVEERLPDKEGTYLTYTDKKSIDNIDYVLQKVSNGSNKVAQIEVNDALNSLLKLVAKYHV
jgi:hypothetical protein